MRELLAMEIVAILLLPLNLLCADEPNGSLRPLFDEAQKLDEDQARQDEVIAKLEAIVASHRSNTQIYDKSLRQLFQIYAKAGLGEKAAHLAAATIEYESARVQQTIGQSIESARRKFPQEFATQAAEYKKGSPQQHVLDPQSRDHDLAANILQRGNKDLREKSLNELRESLVANAASRQQVAGLLDL